MGQCVIGIIQSNALAYLGGRGRGGGRRWPSLWPLILGGGLACQVTDTLVTRAVNSSVLSNPLPSTVTGFCLASAVSVRFQQSNECHLRLIKRLRQTVWSCATFLRYMAGSVWQFSKSPVLLLFFPTFSHEKLLSTFAWPLHWIRARLVGPYPQFALDFRRLHQRISRILEPRKMFPLFQTGSNPVDAAVVYAILESILGLEPRQF